MSGNVRASALAPATDDPRGDGDGGNTSRAAKLLDVTRGQLYSLLRKHGLTDARR